MSTIQNSLSSFVGITDLSDGIVVQVGKGLGKLGVTALSLYGAYHLIFDRSIEQEKVRSETYDYLNGLEIENPYDRGWQYAENVEDTCTDSTYADKFNCEKVGKPFITHLLTTYEKGMKTWPERAKGIFSRCMEDESPYCQNMAKEFVKQSIEKRDLRSANKLVKECIMSQSSSPSCVAASDTLKTTLFENKDLVIPTRLARQCLQKGGRICDSLVPETMEQIVKTNSWPEAASILTSCQKSDTETCRSFTERITSLSLKQQTSEMNQILNNLSTRCLSRATKNVNPRCDQILEKYASLVTGDRIIPYVRKLAKSKHLHAVTSLNKLLNRLNAENHPDIVKIGIELIQKETPGVTKSIEAIWTTHLKKLEAENISLWGQISDPSQTLSDLLENLAVSSVKSDNPAYQKKILETIQLFQKVASKKYHYRNLYRIEEILSQAVETGNRSPCDKPLRKWIESLDDWEHAKAAIWALQRKGGSEELDWGHEFTPENWKSSLGCT